ncbi:MAG: hypothetical protein M0002_17490 [Rhodospirillales bacterium]|nr:hypothetical protein [Rhodospirillales bacterium]
MRISIVAWLTGFVLVTLLYVAGPALYFNRATPFILGMPPLYFWFVLVPVLSLVILGIVYLVDRASGGVGSGIEEPRQ